jgi:hypothetical protein
MGGNEILTEVHGGKGTTAGPAAFSDLNDVSRTRIEKYSDHWFLHPFVESVGGGRAIPSCVEHRRDLEPLTNGLAMSSCLASTSTP